MLIYKNNINNIRFSHLKINIIEKSWLFVIYSHKYAH